MMVTSSNYPQSDEFFAPMPEATVDRLRACGWHLEPALFLEIPYNAISGVGAGVARDYEHLVYWKFLCATEGALADLTDTELRVVAEHEQAEIELAEIEKSDPAGGPALATWRQEDAARHAREFSELGSKYGDAVRTSINKVQLVAQTRPLIPRLFVQYWISVHLLRHYDQFRNRAVPMSEGMKSKDQRRAFMRMLWRTVDKYGFDALEATLKPLILAAVGYRPEHPPGHTA